MSTDLTTTTTSTLAVPDYLQQESNALGTEHLTSDDVAMPRLSLAQAMSDQVNKTHADYIDGLGVGDFYNSVSGVIYGPGPLRFAILCSYRPRGVEFAPIEQGGGIVDLNVPLTDPRMMFGPEGEAPQATRFYDYVLMLNPGDDDGEVIAMSLARSGVKAAKSLNGLVRMRGTAIFTGIYTAESLSKTASQGTYMTWRFRNAGFIAEADVAKFAALHTTLAAQAVTTDTKTLADVEVL